MNVIEIISQKYPHWGKSDETCAKCGIQQRGDINNVFRGIWWRQIDEEIFYLRLNNDYASQFFGYCCENCHFEITGIDRRGKNIADDLHELNEQRKNDND